MNLLLLALLIATLLGGLSIVVFTFVCDISPMPSSRKVKRIIMELVEKQGMCRRMYDLGSGWGTLLSALSHANPNCQVTGFERSPVPYLTSRVFLRGRKNCSVVFADMFGQSIAEADVVVCYLCTSLMSRLRRKFDNELKPGAVVISSTFAVPGWQPVETVTADDLYRTPVYVYRKE